MLGFNLEKRSNSSLWLSPWVTIEPLRESRFSLNGNEQFVYYNCSSNLYIFQRGISVRERKVLFVRVLRATATPFLTSYLILSSLQDTFTGLFFNQTESGTQPHPPGRLFAEKSPRERRRHVSHSRGAAACL